MAGNFSVISFPKSGRTWLRVMLDDVGVVAEYTHDFSGHTRRKRISEINPDKSGYATKRILFLVRDPRDTAVSGYFQASLRLKLDVGSMSDFLRDERHGIRKICDFNNQWFAAGYHLKHFAMLSYEQMHLAPKEALIAAANFAGTYVPDVKAEQIVSNRQFSRMQASEQRGEFARYGEALTPGDRNNRESFKVRRGIVGGFNDYFSAEDLSLCDQVLNETNYQARCNEAMSRWGFERLRSIAAI